MANKISISRKTVINRQKANQLLCYKCGRQKSETDFYASFSTLNEAMKKIPYCKMCILSFYDEMLALHGNKLVALFETCNHLNIPFIKSIYIRCAETQKSLIASYINIYNKRGINNVTESLLRFHDGDFIGEEEEHTNSAHTGEKRVDINENVKITKQDKEVKAKVVKVIGYDVFEGSSEVDQKFLYNDLINYLDDDTIEDNFKISVIIQIVTNNNQIRRADNEIASLDMQSGSTRIKELIDIKNKLVNSNDKLARENAISIKNREDKTGGRSTLTYLMKQYREMDIDEAEVDYYDQEKAYGMKVSAEISTRCLLEQLQLDENDYTEIITTQREIVQKTQEKIMEIEEENRILHKRISELTDL